MITYDNFNDKDKLSTVKIGFVDSNKKKKALYSSKK